MQSRPLPACNSVHPKQALQLAAASAQPPWFARGCLSVPHRTSTRDAKCCAAQVSCPDSHLLALLPNKRRKGPLRITAQMARRPDMMGSARRALTTSTLQCWLVAKPRELP